MSGAPQVRPRWPALLVLATSLLPRGLHATASQPQGDLTKLDLRDTASRAGLPMGEAGKPRAFTVAELIGLANALEGRGEPQRAIEVMDKFRFNFADRAEYWQRLALLYENDYEFDKALSCHEQVSRIQGLTVADGLRQAQLLSNLLRPAGALQRLLSVRGKATETDLEYWNLLGDLALRVENYQLATQAYALVWKHYKTQDAAERLVQALEAAGRSRDAIAIAIDSHRRFGASKIYEFAIEIAMNAGLMDQARLLFARTRGKEALFGLRAQFWYQRGLFAIAEDQPDVAEQDLRRALAIDPGLQAAHIEWLRLAVQTQDRAMAGRAVGAWSGEQSPDQAGLLAEAYALLGDRGQSRRFRRLERAERGRQAPDAGAMTSEERLDWALEQRDRRLIARHLAQGGASLSLPIRVAALRELGQDHDAWRLIDAAGLNQRGHGSADALALGADIRSLRETHRDGVWGWARMDSLGQLFERSLGTRFELRFGELFVGAEAIFDRLSPPADRRKSLPDADSEQTVRFTARLHQRAGETELRAGAALLPEGARPQLQLRQRLKLLGDRMDLKLAGSYGEVPRHSLLLRLAGLRDGIDVDVTAAVAGPLELGHPSATPGSAPATETI